MQTNSVSPNKQMSTPLEIDHICLRLRFLWGVKRTKDPEPTEGKPSKTLANKNQSLKLPHCPRDSRRHKQQQSLKLTKHHSLFPVVGFNVSELSIRLIQAHSNVGQPATKMDPNRERLESKQSRYHKQG